MTMRDRGISKSVSAGSNIGTCKNGAELHVTLLGSAAVGKTSLTKQFMNGQFTTSYSETVEELTRVSFENNSRVFTLNILDTAGAYQFPAMRRLAIANSDAFILVYSVDDQDSFSEVTAIHEEILKERGHFPSVPIVVVGNKADTKDNQRQVSTALGEAVACLDWNAGFVEASAKDPDTVLDIFKEVLKQARVEFKLSPAVRRRRQFLMATVGQAKEGGKKKESKSKLPFIQSFIHRHPSFTKDK